MVPLFHNAASLSHQQQRNQIVESVNANRGLRGRTHSSKGKLHRRYPRASKPARGRENVRQAHMTESVLITADDLVCNHASSPGAGVILSKQERKKEHDRRRYPQNPKRIDVR